MGEIIICARDLSVGYEKQAVVSDIAFEVKAGCYSAKIAVM